MILYHGTTESIAKRIFRDKRIKTTTTDTARYKDMGHWNTTPGFVYVSNIINVAWGYAIEPSGSDYPDGRRSYVLFKINVPDAEVEIDMDNEEMKSCVSQLYQNGEGCYRISRDLIFGTDVIGWVSISIRSYNEGCRYADSEIFPDKVNQFWRIIN